MGPALKAHTLRVWDPRTPSVGFTHDTPHPLPSRMRTPRALAAALAATFLPAAPVSAADYGPAFQQHWHDGNAELAGYRLTFPRYGEQRQGSAVAITVTEPFLWEPRVKNEGRPDADGSFGVVKLNLVEDFPTGVYDYNLMTSVFVAAEPVEGLPAGAVVKNVFSSQEWCGQVFQQATFDDGGVDFESYSYFQREANRDLSFDADGGSLTEDALFLWARGLAGPAVESGGAVEVPIFRGSVPVRLDHLEPGWDTATLFRAKDTRKLDTVLGPQTEVRTCRARITRRAGDDGTPATVEHTFVVEAAPPHRVIRMTRSDGYDAELVGVARLPYWSLNGPEGKEKLADFGLKPRARLAP